MIIRCSWCKTITGNKPPYGGRYDTDITDGICQSCLEIHFPEVARELEHEQAMIAQHEAEENARMEAEDMMIEMELENRYGNIYSGQEDDGEI